jgi:hypothetical protein
VGSIVVVETWHSDVSRELTDLLRTLKKRGKWSERNFRTVQAVQDRFVRIQAS